MNDSQRIDRLIAETTDWRGAMLAKVRKAFLDADPEIVEEWKWMGTPTWSRDGLIAVANPHKDKVKVTFAYGASLDDPDKLFNAGFEGNARRAIDIFEGDTMNERTLTKLVRAAIAYNQAKRSSKKAPAAKRAGAKKATAKRPTAKRPTKR